MCVLSTIFATLTKGLSKNDSVGHVTYLKDVMEHSG